MPNTLEEKYAIVLDFLLSQPDLASHRRDKGKPLAVNADEYRKLYESVFTDGRRPRLPKTPTTVPDPMVGQLLSVCFHVSPENLQQLELDHLRAMACEGLIGSILEHYVASIAEENGWVWCSGELVRFVDFVKPPDRTNHDYRMLQIKNRDNSENSAGASVRTGTTIEKWHRTKSRSGATNWDNFPDPNVACRLCEADFVLHAREYIAEATILATRDQPG